MNYKLLAEKAFFKNYITKLYPTGVCSYVSDTYNYWDVLTIVVPWAKQDIMSRKPNALGLNKVVFRPDSGDPADIICGLNYFDMDKLYVLVKNDNYAFKQVYLDTGACTLVVKRFDKFYEVELKNSMWYDDFYYDGYEIVKEVPEHEVKGSIEVLWDIFGGTVNEKGYKELDPHVGLIYGDSITLERAQDILSRLEAKGFASTNVVFGIGSFTYQYVTRDTFGFAMKATYAEVNGVGRELFKDPKTDSGTKKSAKGLLRVQNVDNQYILLDQQTKEEETEGALKTVFKDGVLTVNEKLSTIRARVQYSLDRELEDSV